MEELHESKLGTKTYWDQIYSTEITNFKDFGDKGEVWFGTESAEAMTDWVLDNIPKTTRIVDLGCGNGHLVFDLHLYGYTNLLGVDYSEASVELCKSIAEAEENDVEFEVLDILDSNQISKLKDVELLMDKGTFDAISLGQRTNGISPANVYVESVAKILQGKGMLILTSCNWTEEEILARFPLFELHDRIEHPSFTFGGVKGRTVTTVILKPKD